MSCFSQYLKNLSCRTEPYIYSEINQDLTSFSLVHYKMQLSAYFFLFYINPFVHGRFSRPIIHTHSLPLIFFLISVLRVQAWKRHQNLTFLKNLKPKSSLLNIFQNLLQKWTPHTLLHYFDTQPSICEILIFLHFVCRGSQKCNDIKQVISTRVCKKIFLIKAKQFKIFLY